jgi:hypothetical protein
VKPFAALVALSIGAAVLFPAAAAARDRDRDHDRLPDAW